VPSRWIAFRTGYPVTITGKEFVESYQVEFLFEEILSSL
jgi:hypothetical protein